MPFFEVGNEVRIGSKPYRLTVVRSRPDGTYDLETKDDDGKKYFKVSGSSLVPYHQIDGTSRTRLVDWNRQCLSVGTRVMIRSSPGDAIAQGKGIIVSLGEGKSRCDVKYDDGSLEIGIPSELLFSEKDVQGHKTSKTKSWIDDDDAPQYDVKNKVIVEMMPKPGSLNPSKFKQYGEVLELIEGGVDSSMGGSFHKYKVKLEDGRTIILPENKLISKASSRMNDMIILTHGMKLQVKYPDGNKYSGKIKSICSDGTLIVRYEDSCIELGVSRDVIQLTDKSTHQSRAIFHNPSSSNKSHMLRPIRRDSIVLACIDSGCILHRGKVVKVLDDDRAYDIDIDGKGIQYNIARCNIRFLKFENKINSKSSKSGNRNILAFGSENDVQDDEPEEEEEESEAMLWEKHAEVIFNLKPGTAVQLRMTANDNTNLRTKKDEFIWHDAYFVRARSDGKTVDVSPVTSNEEVIVRAQPHHVRYSNSGFKHKDRPPSYIKSDKIRGKKQDHKKDSRQRESRAGASRPDKRVSAWDDDESTHSGSVSCDSTFSNASHCSTFTSSSASSSKSSKSTSLFSDQDNQDNDSISSNMSSTSSTTFSSSTASSFNSSSTVSSLSERRLSKKKLPKKDGEVIDANLRRLRSELERLAGLSGCNLNEKENKMGSRAKANIWQLFSSLDVNGSGFVGAEELQNCLRSVDIKLTDRELQSIIRIMGNRLDLDSFTHFIINGDVSYNKYKKTSHLHHHLHHDTEGNRGQGIKSKSSFKGLREESDHPLRKGTRQNRRNNTVQFEDGHRAPSRKAYQGERKLKPPIIAVTPADIS